MRSDNNLKNIIDARLAELTVSLDLEDRIRCASLHKKRYIQKPWAVVVIVCICVMILVPMLASKIPVFQDLIRMIDPSLARFLQPIELVSEDKGIQMEVVAAMSDDETAIVYLTLQDLTGDRVDRTVDLYNYSIDSANAFSHELVDYNEETKTATIRMIANNTLFSFNNLRRIFEFPTVRLQKNSFRLTPDIETATAKEHNIKS
ncbi:DUF4179 domain-containing protein [Paenibacillus etheri]|uniref:DUF4179 domain-containing protein n=1 Tax=Paenibacillus etheri TaxID=1306852 RepID=A0A0W1AXH2_9BACL|nr:DUF4179 domain-containing protein [Paenibacillus etheri]KTD85968.1 hypothetical protein UQ64_17920 [Paenibacillus etheri]